MLVPEIGLTISQTQNGYKAVFFRYVSIKSDNQKYQTQGGTVTATMPTTTLDTWEVVEEIVERSMPEFMWQLAKRIMPK